jgi:hypothetical protein
MQRVLTSWLLGCIFASGQLGAQSATTGALAGVVRDGAGMPLPGVNVTLKNQATNQTQNASSDVRGTYQFSLLSSGSYEIRFVHSGFKTAAFSPVVVNVAETPSVEATLETGNSPEPSVCVCRVSASTSSSGTTVDAKAITAVPLNTRNMTQVLSISSGSAAEMSNAGNLGRNNQAVNVNGNTTAGTFTVEGATAASTVPNPDAISELKIDTSQYDAGFGALVPTTNLIMRSGTSQLHGVIWEFLRNDIFNANSFFRNSTGQSKPNLKQNQYGGTLGGPVVRDKVFFFGSFQGTRQTNGLDPTSASTVILPPLNSDRSAAGLAAQFCPANHPGDSRYQTFAGGKQLDCSNLNTATTAAINPVALKILQSKLADGSYLIPVPQTLISGGVNAGLGFSSYSFPSTFHEDHYLFNTDWVASQRHTIYARFFAATIDQYRSFGSTSGFPGAAILPGPGAPQGLNASDYIGALKLNSVLTPKLANELRVALTRSSTFTWSDSPVTASQFGMTPVNALYAQPPESTVLGPLGTFRFFGNGGNDFSTDTRTTVFTDNASWSHNKHTTRVGGTFLWQDNDRNDTSASRGKVTFQTFSDFLIGLNATDNLSPAGRSNIQTIQANVGTGSTGAVQYLFRRYYAGLYAQDDYKITPKFTLNTGLRWEYVGPSFDRAGTIGSVSLSDLRQAAVPPSSGSLAGYTLAANYNPALVNPYTGKPFGPPPSGVVVRSTKSLYSNGTPLDTFAPRVGFAWQPGFIKRTSVRGGYGWFYQSPVFSGNAAGTPLFVSAPFAQSFTNTDTANSTATLAQPFPTTQLGFVPRTPTSRLSDRIAGPEYRVPLLQQWNVNIQHGLGRGLVLDLGYVGTHGTRLLRSVGYNQPLIASATNPVNCGFDGTATNCITTSTSLNARQRVPVLGENPNALTASEFSGASTYHSLQSTLRKQLAAGLSFQIAYTYSKAMTNTTVMNDQTHPDLSWARASFDRTHRLTTNFSYQIPGFRGAKGFTKIALQNWNVTGLVVLQTGSPLTLTDPNAAGIYGRAATSTITICPGSSYQNLLTSGSVTERIDGWIDSRAICSPSVLGADRNATGYGTAGQSILVGPRQVNTDFSIGKSGRVGGLREDAQLAFRAEFYNATNSPQFANPGTTLGTATFGVITQTSVAPRIIQFALKYQF